MKVFIGILVLLISQFSIAEIVQPSDQSLDNDLSFKLEEENTKKRNIASDKNIVTDEDENSEINSEDDRDIASDKETQDNKIQFWTY